MIARALAKLCFSASFGRQMRFVAGPRQVGKTTLAKGFLQSKSCNALYFNWDLRSVREAYQEDPYFYHSLALQLKKEKDIWICFDEIHKFPRWKNILKDAFDSFEEKYSWIITGSARLDLFRKSGDSLSGRYFIFRLLPVSLTELVNRALLVPDKKVSEWLEACYAQQPFPSDFNHLIQFGGFPEPLEKGDEIFSKNWHELYLESLIREDLRDLTRIHELENISTLIKILRTRIASPLSVLNLQQDLGVSYNAVKNYLKAIILTYVLFELSPYSKKIHRLVTKEKKVYFWDTSQVLDESQRFENYVAVELKNRLALWELMVPYRFDLFYVRNQDKRETDFLITRDNKPFCLIEAKLSDIDIPPHHRYHARLLGNIPVVQIIKRTGILKVEPDGSAVISADRFF